MRLLRENVDFHGMCVRLWRSHSFLERLLVLRGVETKGVPRNELIKRVYQCTIVDQFEDITSAKAESKAWGLVAAQRCVRVREMTPGRRLVLQYLKQVLGQGVYFSLPSNLFNAAEAYVGPHNAEDMPSSCLAAAARATVDFSFDDLPDTVIFMVVNLGPQRRELLKVPHLLDVPTRINVSRCAVVAERAVEQQVVVSNDFRSHASLDLDLFIDRIGDVLLSLFSWRTIGSKPVLQNGAPRLSDMVALEDDYSLPTPVGSRPLRRRTQLASTPLSSRALVPVVDAAAETAGSVRSLHIVHLAQTSDDLVPFSSLQGLAADEVHRLQLSGALFVAEDDFGEMLVGINKTAVQWSTAVTVGSPVQVSAVPDNCAPLQSCKLSLVIRHHAESWAKTSDALSPWKRDDPLLYALNWNRPRSYFAALVEREYILQKGAPEVKHNASDGYYRCLLQLAPAKLANTLRLMDGMPHEWFVQELKESDVAEAVETLEPHQLAIADVNVPHVPADFGQFPIVPSVVSFRGFARQIVDVGPGAMSIKVYFDNFSSTVELQRGWTDCSIHDCRPYRPVDCSLRDFCAMMYAWHVHGLRPDLNNDRGLHARHKPTPTEISEYRRKVRLVPF